MAPTCIIALAALALTAPSPSRAQQEKAAGWSIELYTGSAASVPTRLTIQQSGFEDIRMTAHYATRPWTGAPYYAFRIGRWNRGRAWELELVHHKLYLTNPPPEIQNFEVTHGYNLITVNRAVLYGGVIARVGVGAIVVHPEASVHGQPLIDTKGNLGRGYSLTGPTLQIAAQKRIVLWRQLFLGLEGKVTGSYARFSVTGGSATVPNVALHGLLGFGWGI